MDEFELKEDVEMQSVTEKLLIAIRIIAEECETKEEFLKKLDEIIKGLK